MNLEKRLRQACVVGIVHGIIEHGNPTYEYVDAFKFYKKIGYKLHHYDMKKEIQ